MPNSTNFNLIYEGQALVTHEIDVKDLAPALLAIGELVEDSNYALNGDRVKIVVNIRATNPGSVEISLSAVQSVLTQAMSLFNSDEVNAIVNANELLNILFYGAGGVIGLVGLVKWMRGRKISKITKIDAGRFNIELEDGEVQVASKHEVKLFGLVSIRKQFEAIVKTPLSKDGIDKIRFLKESSEQEISKQESEYFLAPEVTEEQIDESEVETNLQMVNISFQEDGKWRFSDGNATFFAEILDNEFLTKVQHNEITFAKDDILKVLLYRRQYLINGTMKTDYKISKVVEHRSAVAQITLPMFGMYSND